MMIAGSKKWLTPANHPFQLTFWFGAVDVKEVFGPRLAVMRIASTPLDD
jgi:hypothetical protein